MRSLFPLALFALTFAVSSIASAMPAPLVGKSNVSDDVKLEGKVLFLGDSITHAGFYVSMIDLAIREGGVAPFPEMINLGLPSETVTGLSEPEHPWPRPNVHERLDRALDAIQPDLVFTYSNDGVHADADGHRVMARTTMAALGREPKSINSLDPETYNSFHHRHQILHHAWLTHVGHTRPATKVGLPLEAAKKAVAFPESETPIELFNGVDLKGWDGNPDYWTVEDGVIVARNTGVVPSSNYLFSGKDYRNFRLIFEVRQTVSPKHSTMHSAVAVLGERFGDKGGNAHGFKGPLLMFCHDWGIWDAYRRNRIEPAGQKGALRIDAERVGDWNLCEVLVTENRIRFVANGHLVFDYLDHPDWFQASPIGLQLHSNKRPQEYRFRGIVISESPENQLVTLED